VLPALGFVAPDGFDHYVHDVRATVLDLLERRPGNDGRSALWQPFLRRARYVFDLPPEHLLDLRQHTYHFTGDGYLPYVEGTADRWLERTWAKLTEGVPVHARCHEPAGGIGCHLPDGLVSIDACRFQTAVNALRSTGSLSGPVVEIGAGYGGLTRHLRRMTGSEVAYVVDLPETLFFAAIYLRLTDDVPVTIHTGGVLPDSGYVLVPDFLADVLETVRAPLAVNVMSFQEMTRSQVLRYLDLLALVCQGGTLLSLNQDRHDQNRELDSLWTLLAEHTTIVSTLPGRLADGGTRRLLHRAATRAGLVDTRSPMPALVHVSRFSPAT
jgi:hypothetical protein